MIVSRCTLSGSASAGAAAPRRWRRPARASAARPAPRPAPSPSRRRGRVVPAAAPGQAGARTGAARTDSTGAGSSPAEDSAAPGDLAIRLELPLVSDARCPRSQVAEVQRRVGAELRPDRAGDRRARRAVRRGRASELALVGGPVRDAMLGRLQNDLDFTTSARPEVTERLLKGWADAIWDMGRAFGTIGCRKGDWQVEITTYRSEAYDPSSRKPEVDYGDTLAGDLGRRDFTVNAMAVAAARPRRSRTRTAASSTWPTGCCARPGTPEDSFSDDPLRMMRAARFAAQLGFTVAPEVVAAMTAMAERIDDRLRRAGPRRAGQAGLRAVPAARPDPAGRDRPGRRTCCPSCRRWRWSATSTTGTRTSTSTP